MQVSGATRNDTWGLMLDLERQVRYYGKLADRYSLRYRAIRYFLLMGVLGEGAAVYFLSGRPPLLWVLGGLGAAGLGFATIFDAVTNYAETAAVLRLTSELCDELKTEGEKLWRDIESNRLEDAEAEARYREITDHWFRATRRVGLALHNHDNVEAAKEAYETVSNRYGERFPSIPT